MVPAPLVTIASCGGGGAGVWDRIMDALAAGHDAATQMIDTSVVRVHQHGACISDNNHQAMGRSRGGLTSKIHAVVDTSGLPVQLALTPGEAHDNRLCSVLLSALLPQTMLLADRGGITDIAGLAAGPALSRMTWSRHLELNLHYGFHLQSLKSLR